jgi:carboxylesterase type B
LSSIYSGAGNNAFLYNFNYRLPASSIPKSLTDYFGPATHGDELWATFADPVSPDGFSDFTQADRDLTARIVSYWTNFVKFDSPSAVGSSGMTNWLPYASTGYETGRYLLMSKEGMTMQAGIRHCQFWDRQWFN